MAASNGGDSILAQNQRLFDVFKEKFSDRPFFAAAAKKFGQWLSNEKAYYAEARKEIVEILSVAEETFHQAEEKLRETTEAHQDQLGELGEAQLALRQAAESQHRQMSAQYTRLILCVAPFQERFVEPDLQASIAKLLASVRNPSAVTVPQIPPPDAVHTPTAIDRSQQMRPSSSSLAAALTPPVPRATQSTVTPTNDPPMSGKDNPNNANAPSVPDAQPQPVRSQPLDAASGSASAPVASSSKPKRRKKKKEDLSKFIQADVQHYKQKMATVPKPVEVPHATAPRVQAPALCRYTPPQIILSRLRLSYFQKVSTTRRQSE
ncbi:hypothetical protein DFH09DRAFT_13436 [Mycena vulgaris]|nr:hypothetical protein DFH09DRAFT_13436 [Mycena vulgaris]